MKLNILSRLKIYLCRVFETQYHLFDVVGQIDDGGDFAFIFLDIEELFGDLYGDVLLEPELAGKANIL